MGACNVKSWGCIRGFDSLQQNKSILNTNIQEQGPFSKYRHFSEIKYFTHLSIYRFN